jgi:predicted CopG family antitoxin
MKTIQVSDENWQKLMVYKTKDLRTSMDEVITDLLEKYCIAYNTCSERESK